MNHITSPHLWLLSVALAMNPCLGPVTGEPRENAPVKEQNAPVELAPAGPRSLRPAASPAPKVTTPSSHEELEEHRSTAR